MRKIISALAVCLFIGGALWAAEPQALPVKVAASDKNIVYVGRFTDDHNSGWTGSTIRLRFKGTAINAEMKLTKSQKAAMQVVVDGKPTQTLILTPGQTLYELARDLPAGEHTIELFRRSEGFTGEIQFQGFQLSEGATVLPIQPKNRKILVVGDSITCGYGNEAPSKNIGNTPENENGYLTYAPIAARKLNADVMMVCWSGKGLFRNRGNHETNDKKNVMPDLFEQTLPINSKAKWDHAKFVPDIVVVNLGTNDRENHGGKKSSLKKDDYLNAYRKFIQRIQKFAPKAQIIVSIGPMGVKPFDEWLKELAAESKNVHVLIFPQESDNKYIGGHWHPSVLKHKRMGDRLAKKITTITDWKIVEEDKK